MVFFAAEEIQIGIEDTRFLEGQMWAGGKALIWTPTKERGNKSFKIPIEETGKKQIHVAFGMTPESGKVAFQLDGRPLLLDNKAEDIDLHCSYGTLLRSIALMPMDLDAGDHTLTILWKGTGAGVAEPKVWIDFVWVQKR